METTTPALDLWEQILEDPRFRDFPGKVETNAQGQIIMSPHKLKHSKIQALLVLRLDAETERLGLDGDAAVEVAIATTDGVKTADVAWLSAERQATMPENAPASPVAPEVCIEVRSASNTDAEMEHKRRLYVEAGAQEVWIVGENGAITFYVAGEEAPIETSRLLPEAPRHVRT